MHSLDSAYVKQQLLERTAPSPLNRRVRNSEGQFVLYWIQSTHRLNENWALRHATLEADRLGLPLLIYQGLDPTYPYATDRVHTFVLQGAIETSQRARELGLTYRFSLRRTRADDRRVVDRIAGRAALVVTDAFPTAGIRERNARFAARASCPVVAVDSAGVLPVSAFPREEYGAFTIRKKLLRALDHYLEPVEDRLPRRDLADATLASLDFDAIDLDAIDISAEVARCEIDHQVTPAPIAGGPTAAHARLDRFVRGPLHHYHQRRRSPADDEGSSRLSRWLHFGMIAPAHVVRRARWHARGDALAAFLDEMVVWRELALNFCWRNRHFRSLRALPRWVLDSMREHTSDRRPILYSRAELERADTDDDLWNAAQRELLGTGTMHNAVRQLWGKSVILWTDSYSSTLRRLLHLNDRWALDGRDPNGYANIQWCLGKFDRPFPERPIWGKIRPMSLERARDKFDADTYITRWSP